jgi:hypothetical protein
MDKAHLEQDGVGLVRIGAVIRVTNSSVVARDRRLALA